MLTTPTTPVQPEAQPTELSIANSAAEIKAAIEQPAVIPPEPPGAAIPAAPPAAPLPYTVTETAEGVEIRTDSGSVYKGKTWKEAADGLIRGKAEADRTIERLKLQPAVTPSNPVQELPAENPEEVAAREWVISQVAKGLGIPVDRFKQAAEQMFDTSQKTAQAVAWSDFTQACPDYVDSKENAEALVDYLPVEVIARERAPNAEDLRRAHAMALYERRYAPVNSSSPQGSAQRIPPAMPSSGAGQQPPEPDPYRMPLAELRKAALG